MRQELCLSFSFRSSILNAQITVPADAAQDSARRATGGNAPTSPVGQKTAAANWPRARTDPPIQSSGVPSVGLQLKTPRWVSVAEKLLVG